jgi:hypothetical protein
MTGSLLRQQLLQHFAGIGQTRGSNFRPTERAKTAQHDRSCGAKDTAGFESVRLYESFLGERHRQFGTHAAIQYRQRSPAISVHEFRPEGRDRYATANSFVHSYTSNLRGRRQVTCRYGPPWSDACMPDTTSFVCRSTSPSDTRLWCSREFANLRPERTRKSSLQLSRQ